MSDLTKAGTEVGVTVVQGYMNLRDWALGKHPDDAALKKLVADGDAALQTVSDNAPTAIADATKTAVDAAKLGADAAAKSPMAIPDFLVFLGDLMKDRDCIVAMINEWKAKRDSALADINPGVLPPGVTPSK